MATPQGDGSIILTTAIDQSGLKKGIGSIKSMAKTATKAFLAVGAAAATATIAIAKASVDAFAEYEQLVGGVETLFKGSSKKLIEYANQAYKTAGVSANEYMSIVTSFSASLLQSLGGDTEKAADIANQALIDMSDNANKMGTSMESIQYAYQGFAKQNYTMLDNLKLGYGGTKTEMERLLKDAQALTGVKYDITNLADVYTAIHVIQENLGIAGTTALEAEKTISGSAATMKAAWQNVLTAISGGGDLDRTINNLVDSVSSYFENIVPVVEKALSGIGKLIENVAPQLVRTVAKSLIAAIPSLLNAVYEMIIGLAKGIYQGIIDLFNGTSREVLTEQADNIEQSVENQNDLTKAVEETNKEVKKSLAGFDELQILSSGASEEATFELPTASKDTFITAESIVGEEKNTDATPFENYFARILTAMQPLIEATKEWLNNLDFTPLKSSLEGLLKPLESIGAIFQDVLYWAYTEVLLPLSTWTINELAPVVVNALGAAFDTLSTVLRVVWDGFELLYERLEPIFDWVKDTAIYLIDKLGDAFLNVVEVFNKKSPKIKEIFEKIGEVVQTMWTIVEPIFNWLKELIADVFDTLDEIVGDIIDIFYDLIDFIANIFKGDWEKAWNSVLGVFKGIINLIIDALNILIRGLNKIHFEVPDWDWLPDNVQGKSFGINIPQIPRLAQGAVIPPNREFLAVLGDQKQGTNIEAPLQTIVDAFNIALQNNGGGQTTKEEHYYLGETELMSIIYKLVKGGERLQGNSLISSGGVY